MRPHPLLASATGPARVELVLRDGDGNPWPLVFSAGTERFIGRYPRIGGIGCDGPLLCYRRL